MILIGVFKFILVGAGIQKYSWGNLFFYFILKNHFLWGCNVLLAVPYNLRIGKYKKLSLVICKCGY